MNSFTEQIKNLLHAWQYFGAVALVVKNLPINVGDTGDGGSILRRAQKPTPVFLSGESHGRRNLEGYSLGCCKE